MRLWTLGSGDTLEAEYVLSIGDKSILRRADGKEFRVLTSSLSAEDLEYVELANPPSLKLTFQKDTDQIDRVISIASKPPAEGPHPVPVSCPAYNPATA